MLKSNADLKDREWDQFNVEINQGEAKWSEVLWMTFTKTIAHWASSRHRIGNGISFTDAVIAVEVAKAIKAAHPGTRVRVIRKNTIIEETFVGEM